VGTYPTGATKNPMTAGSTVHFNRRMAFDGSSCVAALAINFGLQGGQLIRLQVSADFCLFKAVGQ
jgi:hypothetical protein